ncbi:MAG: winged helix-turn-helix transcriptional regulator [Chloroflexi bacterium]|nr:winged helix-turn-helix transcriptional regulator [Chloroflexota bacterium]
MSLDSNIILAPKSVTSMLSVSPAHNGLLTLSLLFDSKYLDGFDEWVYETASSISAEDLQAYRAILDLLYDYLSGKHDRVSQMADFPALLSWISEQDPIGMRDTIVDSLLNHYAEKSPTAGLEREPNAEELLLASEESYLAFLETMYQIKGKENKHDPGVITYRYHLLTHPDEMREQIVVRLKAFWEEHAQAEWERVRPIIEESVRAFQSVDLDGLTVFEAIRAVTGRDMSSVWDEDFLAHVEQITFVPSAHIGPYVFPFFHQNSVILMFGARTPPGVRIASTALSRSELLVRLNALADDTRLRIIELLTQQEEMCAQDIMGELSLSQSSASRHLRQLSATGYLVERTHQGAKCYRLNVDRFNDTIKSLSSFVARR